MDVLGWTILLRPGSHLPGLISPCELKSVLTERFLWVFLPGTLMLSILGTAFQKAVTFTRGVIWQIYSLRDL